MKLNRRLVMTLIASTAILSSAAIAQQRVFFGIATGGTGGTYYPLGGMLAQLISNKATVDGKKNYGHCRGLRRLGGQCQVAGYQRH